MAQEIQDILSNTVIKKLEEGLVVWRFYFRRKPEKRVLRIRLDTRQLFLYKPQNQLEQTIDLRTVREIRRGSEHRNFEQLPLSSLKALKIGLSVCILYGMKFVLSDICFTTEDNRDQESLLLVLQKLVLDTQTATYQVQVETWLRKEFYLLSGDMDSPITLKHVKAWLPRIGCKCSVDMLSEVLHVRQSEIDFGAFASLYFSIVNAAATFQKFFSHYFESEDTISPDEFQQFLVAEQQDNAGNKQEIAIGLMKRYCWNYRESSRDLCFTQNDFMNFIYSRENSILNPQASEVCQDMTRPLSHYWISSSHNTYLTGDQVRSESSCEAYVRVLHSGCRCIELDCWPGPNGIPSIFHGHTLTSKIKFDDVVKTIRDHAWVASDLPLILSIENHCGVGQQKTMADIFKKYFGSHLVTDFLDKDAHDLPSPQDLRKRIIIKHKKLSDLEQKEKSVSLLDDEVDFADLSRASKNGFLERFNYHTKEWVKNFVVLTSSQLQYTSDVPRIKVAENDGCLPEDDVNTTQCFNDLSCNVSAAPSSNHHDRCDGSRYQELHCGEPWFHSYTSISGRAQSEELLVAYQHYGNGAFLVRESGVFVGDYTLSFLHDDTPHHCHIRSKLDKQDRKFYLVENHLFDSLYELVRYYQLHPVRTNEFFQNLTKPVPQQDDCIKEDWFYTNLTREGAEELLSRVREEGAFLIRSHIYRLADTMDHDTHYAISFRADKMIRHCHLSRVGRMYRVGEQEFPCMQDVVSYYGRCPLYHGVCLTTPVTKELAEKLGADLEDECLYASSSDIYTQPNAPIHTPIRCYALYHYNGKSPKELTFQRGDIIRNVRKTDDDWWVGDFGDQAQKFFPSNFVELMSEHDDGEMETGGTVDLSDCRAQLLPSGSCGNMDWREHTFQVVRNELSVFRQVVMFSAKSRKEADDWISSILECAKTVKGHQKTFNIAKRLSNLIIYCQSSPFPLDKGSVNLGDLHRRYFEMSSLPEGKMEKYCGRSSCKQFLKLNSVQTTRTYPRGNRFDSSNMDPLVPWNCGVCMVALNYQTADRAMHLNHTRFSVNGQKGYVLKPDCLFSDSYDPHDPTSTNHVQGVQAVRVALTVIGARNLRHPSKRGIVISPFVEVEAVGADYDTYNFSTSRPSGDTLVTRQHSQQKGGKKQRFMFRTKKVFENGLNPIWGDSCEFVFLNPDLGILRFVVKAKDIFGDGYFIGQGAVPVKFMREGFRAVCLLNGFNEELELSSLLVHVKVSVLEESDREEYMSQQELELQRSELQEIGQLAVQQTDEDQTPLQLQCLHTNTNSAGAMPDNCAHAESAPLLPRRRLVHNRALSSPGSSLKPDHNVVHKTSSSSSSGTV